MMSSQEMEQLWGTGDHVQCIHPLAGCIAGRVDVRTLTQPLTSTLSLPLRLTLTLILVSVLGRKAQRAFNPAS